MTAFFLPGVEPDRAEARYGELAALVGAVVVRPADRVRSVEFVHGAEEWTATVGERLSGALAGKTVRPARRSSPRSAPVRRVSDTATVQAILDLGDAYRVLTDAPPVGEVVDSTWDNPVPVAGRSVRRVLRFGE